MRERMRHTQTGRGPGARTRTAAGVSGLLTTAILAATLPGLTLSNASWLDSEWAAGAVVSGPGVGTLDCSLDGTFTTDARGRFLHGSLLGLDLDTIAAIDGVRATNDGATSTATPNTATPLGSDAWANPLDATALSAINLALTGLLQLPLATDTGVYNQYAQAHSNGDSTGASGLVNDSGGIALTAEPPGPHVPKSATLHLGTILETALGSDLSDIVTSLSDLHLGVGAVAAAATLDACDASWSNNLYDHLNRDYRIAGLDLDIESPLVAELVTTVQDAATALQAALNALSSDGDLLDDLGGALVGVAGPLLGAIGLGGTTTTLGLTLDFTAVNDLLDDTISDTNGIVEIDLNGGTINVDIAHLVDSVNGLNNLDPNTQLLLNDTVINTLTAAVTTALADWVTDVIDAVTAALGTVTVDLDIVLTLPTLGTVTVGVDASLASMLGGTAEVAASFAPDGIVCTITPVLCTTVEAAVDALMTTSEDALTLALGNVIQPAISLATSTIIGALQTDLQNVTAPLVTVLANTLDALFGEDRVLSILINAQNAPAPPNTNPEPGWASSMATPSASPYQSGAYGVSALRLDVLGALGGLDVEIDLAHASVGSNNRAP